MNQPKQYQKYKFLLNNYNKILKNLMIKYNRLMNSYKTQIKYYLNSKEFSKILTKIGQLLGKLLINKT